MSNFDRGSCERFLSPLLTPDEASSFEQHIETCFDCREELEHSAGPAQAWRAAREFLVYEPGQSDGSRSALETPGPRKT
jgi:hypothetical protein